jgi:hypothetical protein
MTNNLFFSEILFTIITMVALMVVWQLYISKDGTLRKIMIAYFVVEAFIYSASAIYFLQAERGDAPFDVDIFRLIVLTPKAAIKIWLFAWLVKNNNIQQ